MHVHHLLCNITQGERSPEKGQTIHLVNTPWGGWMKCDQGRGHAGSFLQVSMKPRWWSEVQMVSQVTENGGRSQKYKTDLGVLWLKWQPQPLETIHQEPSYGQGSQS